MAQWRGRIVHNSGEWERQNAALAREKEAMLGHHSALKAALARFRQGQEARLRQMCASRWVLAKGGKLCLWKQLGLVSEHELIDNASGA